MDILINVILIVAVAWFLYKRLISVKGIRDINTTKLKAELKNKDKQFIDVRTPNLKRITLKSLKIFHYMIFRRKQVNYLETKKCS